MIYALLINIKIMLADQLKKKISLLIILSFFFLMSSIFTTSSLSYLIQIYTFSSASMSILEIFISAISFSDVKIILKLVRYITHNSYAISVVPPFNRLWARVSKRLLRESADWSSAHGSWYAAHQSKTSRQPLICCSLKQNKMGTTSTTIQQLSTSQALTNKHSLHCCEQAVHTHISSVITFIFTTHSFIFNSYTVCRSPLWIKSTNHHPSQSNVQSLFSLERTVRNGLFTWRDDWLTRTSDM